MGSPSPSSVDVSSVRVSNGASSAVAVAIAGAIDCGELVMGVIKSKQTSSSSSSSSISSSSSEVDISRVVGVDIVVYFTILNFSEGVEIREYDPNTPSASGPMNFISAATYGNINIAACNGLQRVEEPSGCSSQTEGAAREHLGLPSGRQTYASCCEVRRPSRSSGEQTQWGGIDGMRRFWKVKLNV